MNIIRNTFMFIAFVTGLGFTAAGIAGETAIQQTAGGAIGAALFLFVIVLLLEFHLQRIESYHRRQIELLEHLAQRRPRQRQQKQERQ